jgi:hypothetical protein
MSQHMSAEAPHTHTHTHTHTQERGNIRQLTDHEDEKDGQRHDGPHGENKCVQNLKNA